MENVTIGDGCWIWTGNLDAYGYGRIMINRRYFKAHRLSWIIANRKQIPNGLLVLHSCDNRRCVNPDHLRTGTDLDNMIDRKARGGYATGDDHPLRKYPFKSAKGVAIWNSKLTEKDVKEIRRLYASGNYSQTELAKTFKCVHGTVSSIINRKTWKHI